jgi:hypothetical protein
MRSSDFKHKHKQNKVGYEKKMIQKDGSVSGGEILL